MPSRLAEESYNGNIMQKDFFEIWTGKSINKFRKDLLCGKRTKSHVNHAMLMELLGGNHAEAWKNI